MHKHVLKRDFAKVLYSFFLVELLGNNQDWEDRKILFVERIYLKKNFNSKPIIQLNKSYTKKENV